MNKQKIDLENDKILRSENIEYNNDTLKNTLDKIVESGTNTNGTYIKYASGIMICAKKITGEVKITSSWGSLYDTGNNPLDLGDWPVPFIDVPMVSATFYGANGQWIEGFQTTPTKDTAGAISVVSATSKTANAYYDIIGIGRWK